MTDLKTVLYQMSTAWSHYVPTKIMEDDANSKCRQLPSIWKRNQIDDASYKDYPYTKDIRITYARSGTQSNDDFGK